MATVKAYNSNMSLKIVDKFWHKTLRRPYRLAITIDSGSSNVAAANVVLLHGLGRTGQVWKHVIADLVPSGARDGDIRVVAFDLLGFGASPKPDWLAYGIDDHAQAAIASIAKLRLGQPAVLVGHSMGCLVAVRVARLRPDMVKHLVLYEMPLYEGLPQKRRYRLRTDLYFKIYKRIMRYQPTFSVENARLLERLTKKIVGMEVTAETWLPFIRSLEHTIMRQTAADDIKHLSMPMDVIYGTFDMLVIRGKPRQIFGDASERITAHSIRAGHIISPKASRFLVQRIMAAIES